MARDDNKGTNDKIRCSFCGKPQAQVGQMISGPGVYICDQCVELCMDIVEGIQSQPEAKKVKKATKKLPKPQEIKAVLAEVPSSAHITKVLEIAGLDMEEFTQLYSAQKIDDCIWFAKDLKDRYTVLWMYFLLCYK